jgi:ketosteroid isomerase-like protein
MDKVIAAMALMLSLAGPAAPVDPPTPLRALVDAELAFAAHTAEHGIRDGFLAYLAEGSIVFRPHPVEARPVYAGLKPSPALLVWYPSYAWISRSGDLGYTTGPWDNFKTRGEKQPSGSGHFVSLWRRQPDGGFKVELDTGISHAAHSAKIPVFMPGPGAAGTLPIPAAAAARAESELKALESGLAEASAARGYAAAIGPLLGPEARIYRDGEFPAIGPEPGLALARKDDARWVLKPGRLQTSSAGDLGYAYGLLESSPDGSRAAFLRIWRRAVDGRWRLALDLVSRLPKA